NLPVGSSNLSGGISLRCDDESGTPPSSEAPVAIYTPLIGPLESKGERSPGLCQNGGQSGGLRVAGECRDELGFAMSKETGSRRVGEPDSVAGCHPRSRFFDRRHRPSKAARRPLPGCR